MGDSRPGSSPVPTEAEMMTRLRDFVAAQAERAFAFWPNRGEPDPRPPLGARYSPVEPVAAASPAVSL